MLSKLTLTVVCAAILAMTVPAGAELTYTDKQDIYRSLSGSCWTKSSESITWDHSSAPTSFNGNNGVEYVLKSAELTVYAKHVDSWDNVAILYCDDEGNTTRLGKLNRGDGWPRFGDTKSETTFDVDPAWLGEGKFIAFLKNASWKNYCEIRKAVLTCTYAPVPAPGALLLGTTGLGMVGYLKRRRPC